MQASEMVERLQKLNDAIEELRKETQAFKVRHHELLVAKLQAETELASARIRLTGLQSEVTKVCDLLEHVNYNNVQSRRFCAGIVTTMRIALVKSK